MKKLVLLLVLPIIVIFFHSCKKGGDDFPKPADALRVADSNVPNVRYQFTADRAAAYKFSVITDGTGSFENTFAAKWSKTVILPVGTVAGRNSAEIIVFTPDDWTNTNNSANVTVKIFVNDVEKASKDMALVWLDKPSLYKLTVNF